MSKPVVVRFIGDAKNLTGTVGQVEGRMGGLKSKLLALGIGTAIFAGAKDAIKAGVDLNETTNKLGLAFGRNAAEIQAWAKGSAKNMGLPKQAAEENAASFGLLFSKLGLTGDETAKMSQKMVQLAVDLGSVHNADPTDILEAQQAAFRGEYDALQRFVPAISAAAVQTEALKETGKRNANELTNQEKATATYNLMLQQTKKEQGDFARTSDQAANKTKINEARIKDLSANIGTLLLPAVTAATNLLGGLGNFMERNKTAATVLATAVVGLTGFILAMNVATKAAKAIQAAIRGATIAWAAAQRILNFALAANPIGLVIVAVAGLIAVIVLAYRHSETFRRIVQGAFRAVTGAASAAWDWIKGHWPLLLGILTGPIGPAILFIVRNFNKIRDIASQAFQWGRNLISNFISGIRAMAGALVSAIESVIPGPIKSFLHLGSPAKEGPMSEDGGPEHWGEKVSLLFTKGLAKGARGLPGDLGGLAPGGGLMPALAGAGGGMSVTVNARTNADAAEIAREVAWQMRTSGR